jgi:hypothetical protein
MLPGAYSAAVLGKQWLRARFSAVRVGFSIPPLTAIVSSELQSVDCKLALGTESEQSTNAGQLP